jgi:WD40 repeat protein
MKRTLLLACYFVITSIAHAQPAGVDALPPRAFQRIGTAKLRHGDRILALAYSPDGTALAAGGGNDPLRIWNPKTGELVQSINEPWVHAMTYSPSGQTLVFGGAQRSVRLWNFQLGKENGRLDGHKAAVKAIAVSPDTTTIASGSQDGHVILWNMENKRKVIEHNAHADEVTALAFSPIDSNVFASAGNDRVIHLWSVETNKSLLKINAGCGAVVVAFAPDGKTLYSAGDDNLIRAWDVKDGQQIATFKGHHDAVLSLVVRGDILISGSVDKTIRLWDRKTLAERKSLSRAQGDSDALAVTKAGDFVATAGVNNAIRIYATADGKEVNPAPATAPLVALALAANQKRLASLTTDGELLTFDIGGKLQKKWPSKIIGDVVFTLSPDGKTAATAYDTIALWNLESGNLAGRIVTRPLDPVVALAFAPDNKRLAIGYASGQIDVADKKATIRSFKYPPPLFALAWSPDGEKLAAAGGSKINVWDPNNDLLLKDFAVREGPAPMIPMIRTLAFGPDSKTLAAGGWDSIIRIYNLNAKNPTERKEQQVCEGHLSAVFALAFSTDGRTLVSGSFDRTVRLWEAFSGKQIANFKGHIGEVHGVAFSRDGRSVFSAATDANILQWDVPGLSNNGKVPELTLGPQEIENAWGILASEETPKGHDMMWRSIASHKQAVPSLTKRLYYLEPELVKKWFRDLDSTHFPTRLAAMKNLEDKGRWMEGRYDAAIATAPSLEYRRRVEILKDKLVAANSPSLAQERLRVRRIMLMCEQVGSEEAIDALRKLGDKGPEEELRDEAKASLKRLGK